MVFYVLSRRIFDYNFKNNEATGFIVSALFFHKSINIAAKFLFLSWILLKIMSLTAVPKTSFHGNFLTFALFWCTILYSDWLKWEAMPYSDWLALIKEFLLKSYFWIKAWNFLISTWISINISANSRQKSYKYNHKKLQHFKVLVKTMIISFTKIYSFFLIFRLHIPTAIYKSKKVIQNLQ